MGSLTDKNGGIIGVIAFDINLNMQLFNVDLQIGDNSMHDSYLGECMFLFLIIACKLDYIVDNDDNMTQKLIISKLITLTETYL